MRRIDSFAAPPGSAPITVAAAGVADQYASGSHGNPECWLSAIANWQAKNEEANLEEADLFVKEITVDSGRMLKRLRPAHRAGLIE